MYTYYEPHGQGARLPSLSPSLSLSAASNRLLAAGEQVGSGTTTSERRGRREGTCSYLFIRMYIYSLCVFVSRCNTDSSSDSASHTHSARRPSATALLTRSRGGGLTPPPLAHFHTQTHTLSYGIAMGVYSLSLSLSLSDALLGSWQL